MTETMQKLAHLLYRQLLNDCPVLSGNMKAHIRIANVEDNKVVYVIDPPFYDVGAWKKTGKFYYRNIAYYKRNDTWVKRKDGTFYIKKGKWHRKKLDGKRFGVISYANWVNDIGAWGSRNESMHWANRACYSACKFVAEEYQAKMLAKYQARISLEDILKNELEL